MIESGNELHHRGFARARRPDARNGFPALHKKSGILNCQTLTAVAERYAIKFNRTQNSEFMRMRRRRIGRSRKNLRKLFHACTGLMILRH